jgi:hypothetical protein
LALYQIDVLTATSLVFERSQASFTSFIVSESVVNSVQVGLVFRLQSTYVIFDLLNGLIKRIQACLEIR